MFLLRTGNFYENQLKYLIFQISSCEVEMEMEVWLFFLFVSVQPYQYSNPCDLLNVGEVWQVFLMRIIFLIFSDNLFK